MSRSSNFGNFYVNNRFIRSGLAVGTGGGLSGVGSTSTEGIGIAQLVLDRFNIPSTGVVGSSLPGYDIKKQNAVDILKLSLLANDSDKFPEVYAGPDGIVRKVNIGQSPGNPALKDCFLTKTISSFVNQVDHVLVKGKDPLPVRYQKGPISLMGKGTVINNEFNCTFGYNPKNSIVNKNAWAEFERSQQSEETQDLIKNLVERSEWEKALGFKLKFSDIPKYASMQVSPQTPRNIGIPFTSQFNTSFTIDLGPTTPESGGVTDISGVNGIGAEVLDIVDGASLLASFPQLGADTIGFTFTDNDYFILLNHQCGVVSISKGTNWYLLPAGETTAEVRLRRSGAARDANKIFNGFANFTYFFRRINGEISSISDMIKTNIDNGASLLTGIGTSASYNPFRGEIVVGIGGTFGVEINALQLSYSISKPSIQVQSPHGDAKTIAANLAGDGVNATYIVVKEEPATTGWNGTEVDPPAPPNEEGVAYEVDSPIDELEGSIVDLSAPWLGRGGVGELSSTIFSFINGDTGQYKSISYRSGGYNLLPGMEFEGGTIQTIDFNFQDKDSMSTNITTGPKYVSGGSYSDSQYIRRSETVSRRGVVVAGSNKDGAFIVEVEGLGRYEAISELIEPIYPGDSVQVEVANVPVELP